MKKLSLIVLCLLAFVVLLSSCGSNGENSTESTTDNITTEAKSENVIIEIEKSGLADIDSFSDDLKAYGAEITDSEDGGKLVCEFT